MGWVHEDFPEISAPGPISADEAGRELRMSWWLDTGGQKERQYTGAERV